MAIFEIIFCRILEMSAIASIVGIVTWSIQKILKRKISPKYLMYLWIVFLLVLINPMSFESPFSIYNKIPITFTEINTKDEKKETLDQHTNQKSIETFLRNMDLESLGINEININGKNQEREKWYQDKIQIVWNSCVLIYWLITIWQVGKWIVIHLKVSQSLCENFQNERLNKILEKARKKLNVSQEIQLISQQRINTPAIYGKKHPKILLNEKILALTDEEIELIFLHELSHLKKNDILLNQFLLLLKSFYWFQPFLNYIFHRIKKDIELANDENVLEKINESQIQTYCKTLLKVSQFSASKVAVVLGMSSHFKELEERIKMIKGKDKFLKNRLLIVATTVTVVLGITVCFATNPIKREENKNSTEEQKYANSTEEQKNVNTTEEEKNVNTTEEEKNEQKDTFLQENPMEEKEVSEILIANPLKELNVTATYSKRIHPITKQEFVHDGIDLKAEKGDKVMTVANGIVENTGFNANNGNFIEIKHEDKASKQVWYSYYAHLSKIEVEVGDIVEAGMKIGEAGSTGMATGPHLHLGIMNEERESIDPSKLLEI